MLTLIKHSLKLIVGLLILLSFSTPSLAEVEPGMTGPTPMACKTQASMDQIRSAVLKNGPGAVAKETSDKLAKDGSCVILDPPHTYKIKSCDKGVVFKWKDQDITLVVCEAEDTFLPKTEHKFVMGAY